MPDIAHRVFYHHFSHFTPLQRAASHSSPGKWGIIITPDLQVRKLMVMLITNIRKNSCLASLFPVVLPPTVLQTLVQLLRLYQAHPGVRSCIPLGGGGAKPQAASTQTFYFCTAVIPRYLLALGRGGGASPDQGPWGGGHLP